MHFELKLRMNLSSESEHQPDEYKSSDNGNECGHKPGDELPEEINSVPYQSVKKKSSGSSQFSNNDILVLARAWIQVSTDAVTSNNHKEKSFWLRVQQQQNLTASHSNNLMSQHQDMPCYQYIAL